MKHFLQIALFTLCVSLLYTGVGQVLPQLENRPPPEVKAGSSIGPDELAEAGAVIFEGNCLQCHKIGEAGRGPDLGGIGQRASERAAKRSADTGKSFTRAEYLMESLCAPGDYLVEGFGNIMPPQGKSLTGGQLMATVAFLESLGGEASIKGTDTKILERFGCGGDEAASGGAAAGAKKPAGKPEEAFKTFGCDACHATTTEERKLGPTLKGLGTRKNRGQIFEAVIDPDVEIPQADPPYPKGVMKTTLDGNGFYDRMTPADYAALVDWLAKL
jgi:cytochrome c2